jgi:Phage minor capsid protein 2
MPGRLELPSDQAALELAMLFSTAERRLLALMNPALSTPAARARSALLLRQVQAVLARLRRDMRPATARAALQGWSTGVDLARPEASVATALGPGPNISAADAIARALANPLARAIDQVGRSADDALRRAGLEAAGHAVITGAARHETAAVLLADLRHQGVTAFVDRAGRRWRLETYAAMVARTTTREAVTAGFMADYQARGGDLVTVSDHDTHTPLCKLFEGKTYSLTGATDGYERIPMLPPFHPNCRHVLFAARVALEVNQIRVESARTIDELERALGIA